jgi:hypothetical protein
VAGRRRPNLQGTERMAKGQKKSNKEVRKPKAEKPSVKVTTSSFLTPPPLKKK